MSWSHTPPPLSPHKINPKQHTANDIAQCGKNYDGERNNSPTSSSIAKKCPSSRKFNYGKYCLPTTPHQLSDPGFYSSRNLKSPKSPSQHFEFELSTPSHFSRSPQKNNIRYYDNTATSDSAPATLSSPLKKYDYNFAPPQPCNKSSSENSAGIKKFECDSKTSDADLSGNLYSINKTDEASASNSKAPLLSPFMENELYFATCNPRKNKIMTKRHYNVSPDGVSSMDDYSTTTLLYETNMTGRRMSITISDGNSSEISSEPLASVQDHESLETSSLTTQSTNFSNTTSNSSPSPSPGLSMATTASCSNTTMQQTQAHLRPKSLSTKMADNNNDDINSQENISLNLHQRRHAINITSNPCYKVLHTSHSILDSKRQVDRTCSDSASELLKHRKSTSDLTDDEQFSNDFEKSSNIKHRRRGSSKGGLAYLVEKRDSRRGSRESVMSHHSNFSNEDIGPLTTFQQTPRGRQRRTSNFLELPVADHVRPRVCSLPDRPYNPRVSEDLYRLRTFSISKGTVVNCGDSIISRRSRSNTSVNSTTSKLSERSPFDGSCCGGYTGGDDSSSEEPTPSPRYRVVMLGESGVGKTALVNQFMTSEYMHTYDASLDDEFGEKTVSVLLDGEESELIFIDHPAIEMSVENSLSTYEPHACVIVYSIVQKSSFRCAEEILNYLWRENVTDKAVIIVGNKADLARSRVISTSDGKQLAANRDVKFIETSSGIQHNVDELLVGILKQIRLKEKQREKKHSTSKMKNSRTHASLHVAKEILQKICFNQLDITKSKSCENLHVL